MKTKIITIVLFFISMGLSAQTTLTYPNNGLVAGDNFTFKEIQFVDPGASGPNQIWDLSKIQTTGKEPISTIQIPTLPKIDGIGDYNLSLLDNGYDYMMHSSESDLQELGYVNSDLKLILRYSDPVIKMKYPFAFGASYTDHFIAVANYSETNIIDFFGDCTVTADAYGTLMLPDRTIANALRVKTVKTGLQVNMCGTTDVNIVKYNWYAAGYRYPLVSINIVENRPNVGVEQVLKTAFTNIQQPIKSISINGAPNSIAAINPNKVNAKPEVTVVVSPNPFTDKLNYSYLLNEQMAVSIELYTISGKNISWLVKDQLQLPGMQTGEINSMMYNLTPGVYFLRFTFDKQVVISKVVRI